MAVCPDRGVPGYSGSRLGHCSARGSAADSPWGPETSNGASPQTKTSQGPPPSGTWGGREGRLGSGEAALPPLCSVTLLSDRVKEGQKVTHRPEWMERFWPTYLISCEGPWAQRHWVAQASADLASRSSQTWGEKGHEIPQGDNHHHPSRVQRHTLPWCLSSSVYLEPCTKSGRQLRTLGVREGLGLHSPHQSQDPHPDL